MVYHGCCDEGQCPWEGMEKEKGILRTWKGCFEGDGEGFEGKIEVESLYA